MPPPTASLPDAPVLRTLDGFADRMGPEEFARRLEKEASLIPARFPRIANAEWPYGVLERLLKSCGLYQRGNRNFRRVGTLHNEVALERLPASFDGFRILQLSDLHLDLDTTLTDVLIEVLGRIDCDLCVITGDFRAGLRGDSTAALEQTGRLLPHLDCPIYGILGNHDSLGMVVELEEMGIAMLLNEWVPITRDGESMFLSGVDDPHYYQTDNFERACEGLPEGGLSILLSHSPETFREADTRGFSLMLSGHTHGGQICLPGGVPVWRNGRCPRQMSHGRWRYRGLEGYTSPGTGSCGVPVRFFCPPEITLHTLRAGDR